MKSDVKLELLEDLLTFFYQREDSYFFEDCFKLFGYDPIFEKALCSPSASAIFWDKTENGATLKPKFKDCSDKEWVMISALYDSEHTRQSGDWERDFCRGIIRLYPEEEVRKLIR